MPKLPRIAEYVADQGWSYEPGGRMEFGLKLIFWALALLAVLALLLHLGAWRRDYKIPGPFPPETNPARHSLILAVPEDTRPKWWMEKLAGDDNDHPFRSVLQLRINGRKMGPAHSQHEAIRTGKASGFSHWGTRVIFSLPPGVKNEPATIASLRYSVRPPAWATFALNVTSGLLGWFLYGRALRSLARRHGRRPTEIALATPYLILLGLCGVALLASAAYILASLYGLAGGWALPTTALIRWSPIAQWAVQNEPYLGFLLLSLAGLGASATWLAGLSAYHRRSIESYERSMQRVLVWCGFPIAASAFILCISAMWTGTLRAGDPNSANIGGLIPFSDAANYLTAAFDQAKNGTWSAPALNRPMAAAFRSVLLLFGNYSLQLMLILQSCLIAAAACFATHAVMMWRGTWAGVAFFALTYIYARYFVPTTLTEPLGLFWALVSVPFFIEAFRDRSARPALIAFALTVAALMTRMGSMFTIPALMLWLVWQFGRGAAAKLRILAVSVGILIGILGLNSLLKTAYGTAGSSGNFAYTLCGLSMGTGWNGCIPKLAAEGKTPQGGREAYIASLYSMAAANIKAEPTVLLGRLADNLALFTTSFPEVMWRGFGTAIEEPNWLFRDLLTAASLIGLCYIGFRIAGTVEITFWLLLWAGIVTSAAIVYLDDGARVLAASHPLIALFFAMGLSNPTLATTALPRRPRLAGYGAAGLLAAAVLFVCVPWIAQRLSPAEAILRNGLTPLPIEMVVFGGRRMSGFLVVEDGLPLRKDIPSLHFSDFETILGQSNVEIYQELLHPVTPPLPFGFVFTPRVQNHVLSNFQFIVPPEVMERHDVPAWRFQLKRWGHKPGNSVYWLYVTKAEPIR